MFNGEFFEFLGGCLRGLIFDEFLIGNKIDNKLKNRSGGSKQTFHPGGVGGEGGVQHRLLESAQQESARVCENDLLRPGPCKQGAAHMYRLRLMPPTS